MAQLDLTAIAAPAILTPAAGVVSVFADPLSKTLKTRNDAGYVVGRLVNGSTSAQTPAASTRTYLGGSQIAVPAQKLQIGTRFHWALSMTKTAAGTGTSTFDVAVGLTGTTADTPRVTLVKPAGTAAADEAWVEMTATVRGPLSTSGVMVGTLRLLHNLATTGHATIPSVVVTTVSAGFDLTIPNLFVGVCLTTGAGDVITIEQVTTDAMNL